MKNCLILGQIDWLAKLASLGMNPAIKQSKYGTPNHNPDFPFNRCRQAGVHITLPKPYDWRLLQPCLIGSINALPESQGVAIATNGILVAIMQPTGLYIGHLQFFIPDEELSESKPKATRKSTKHENIEEFC